MSLKYRPEIDGLRAIAVTAVVFYHAEFSFGGINPFKGGFIGVDIFFVISGYLITSIILRGVANKNFSFVNFYERRARRILPALFVVMLAFVPVAWVYLFPQPMQEYAGSMLSALVFGSNIWFWLEEGSYWAQASLLKPFLHTWSLSVEEQFYLLFPIVLPLLWKFAKKYVSYILILGFVLSLIAAQWGSAKYSIAAFYILPTRGWELLAGAILAKLELDSGRSNHRLLEIIMPSLGLVLICSAIGFFYDGMRHPSFITLFPVVGTMLIIWFSPQRASSSINAVLYRNLGQRLRVSKILESKLFVGIGLISYSFYLWHFPIFAFARINNNELLQYEKVGWIILALILSTGSYFLIEKPARNSNVMGRKNFLLTISFFALVLISIFSYLSIAAGVPKRFANNKLFDSLTRSEFKYFCNVKNETELFTSGGCEVGAVTQQSSEFLLLGDSHALSLLHLFNKLGVEYNKKGLFIFASGCPPLLETYPDRVAEQLTNCKILNDNAFAYVSREGLKQVYLVARWDYYVDANNTGSLQNISTDPKEFSREISKRTLKQQLAHTIKKYNDINVKVIILLQVPHQENHPQETYYKYVVTGKKLKTFHGILQEAIDANSVFKSDHLARQAVANPIIIEAAQTGDVVVIDPTQTFCDLKCYVGDLYGSYYFDEDHLSINGVRLLIPRFVDFFR